MNALAVGAFTLAIGVLFGAFGAHGLANVGAERLGWWLKGSDYHYLAGIGLLALGLLRLQRPGSVGPGWLLLAGLLLFSGSLYALGLGAPRWFAHFTPIGGLCLCGGFLWLGLVALGK